MINELKFINMNSQIIWVCILCRKKQELLSKTGQWINKTTSPDGFARRIEGDKGNEHFDVPRHDALDKRPKLERAHTADEKENLPLQRTGSALRRQYSQQEPPTTRRMSSSDDRVDMMGSSGPRRISAQNIQYPAEQSQQYSSQKYQQQTYQHTPSQQSQKPQHMAHIQGQQTLGSYQQMNPSNIQAYPDDDPSYYQVIIFLSILNSKKYLFNFLLFLQGELDGLMRQHPHLVHPRQQQQFVVQQKPPPTINQPTISVISDDPIKHKRNLTAPYATRDERSYSSSEEDLRSTPEFEGK